MMWQSPYKQRNLMRRQGIPLQYIYVMPLVIRKHHRLFQLLEQIRCVANYLAQQVAIKYKLRVLIPYR